MRLQAFTEIFRLRLTSPRCGARASGNVKTFSTLLCAGARTCWPTSVYRETRP
jgi:hypothetical protein